MTTDIPPAAPDNTPIIIGAGQVLEPLADKPSPPFTSPMALAAQAARAALQDSGQATLNELIDTVAVIRLFSDSAPAWKSPFGGSNNPPESLARHIGATPARRIYSNVSGTQPLQLLMELFLDIARGDCEVALLAGAEAIATERFAQRNQLSDDWNEEFDAPLDNREYVRRLASPAELRSGMSLPTHFYSLVENSQAHSLGHSRDQHRQFMAELLAPLSRVAAGNPMAYDRRVHEAAELAEISKANYPISLPFTKRLVAQDAVNQAAALLLTSAGTARKLGISPEHWTFLHGYAEGEDRILSRREDIGRSAAMKQVISATLAMAQCDMGDIDLIDLYSCFPCAINAAREALDVSLDDPRPLTVTGGLPFFGGPGNNYSLHALAEMAVRLRAGQGKGLVTANGGVLSKHAAAVLSNSWVNCADVGLDWTQMETPVIDTDSIPQCDVAESPDHGRIISYTVIYQRDKPNVGIIAGETESGARFLAHSENPEVTLAMESRTPIGRNVQISTVDERHEFTFAD